MNEDKKNKKDNDSEKIEHIIEEREAIIDRMKEAINEHEQMENRNQKT